ncbi:MAG: hypothetical protein ACU837_09740 [Gammaproteobacteria bacterium]
MNQTPISPYHADLRRKDLRPMVGMVRLLHKLSEHPAYQAFLEEQLPASARRKPGYYSVMMGYDFHLGASGPKLIEVNTNAGGIWYASLCYAPDTAGFPAALGNRLLHSFLHEYALYCNRPGAHPKRIVIVDEQPQAQPLYAEMQVFAALFRQAGIDAAIASPEELKAGDDGLYLGAKRIDMIYNRHCDFYLQTAALEDLRQVWLNGRVCLTPNPRSYGLLADKRRMIIWSQPALMQRFGLSARETSLLLNTLPETHLLDAISAEQAWCTRKHWVFKPDTGYASRGVYAGEKLTKSKFAELDPHSTLIQQRIPPSMTQTGDGETFKTDYRLFAYRDRVIAVSARLYQGQVTNLRTENGGFAKVCLV